MQELQSLKMTSKTLESIHIKPAYENSNDFFKKQIYCNHKNIQFSQMTNKVIISLGGH